MGTIAGMREESDNPRGIPKGHRKLRQHCPRVWEVDPNDTEADVIATWEWWHRSGLPRTPWRRQWWFCNASHSPCRNYSETGQWTKKLQKYSPPKVNKGDKYGLKYIKILKTGVCCIQCGHILDSEGFFVFFFLLNLKWKIDTSKQLEKGILILWFLYYSCTLCVFKKIPFGVNG